MSLIFHMVKYCNCVFCAKDVFFKLVKQQMCQCSDGGSNSDKKRLGTNVPVCNFTVKLSLCKKCLLLTS